MATVESQGQSIVPAGREHPTEAGHKATALPGAAHLLDLEALFRGNVSRLERFNNTFWRSVEGGTLDGCRLWTGCVFPKTGYGRLEVRLSGERKVLYAHRVAWALANRMVVPEGILVRHFCSTRACCNPTHLYLGDYCGNKLELQVVE